ncbi:NAD(P)/FAD-dependent oxidoreductase [Paraburkholderia fungorum]|uniref:NAD(P)/FAD-dependent oxidoreductase n=1 Tax=Paraburkholderia fungorum TaxID=134537 RepID=UPI0038B81CDC
MDNFVIVGAGQAGRRAAEALRERAPDARISIVGEESHLPYDRPSLSKDALFDEQHERNAFVRDANYYDSQRIDMRLGVCAMSINRQEKTLRLDDGSQITYDRLLLSTGSRVRRLEGSAVHYLRTLDDARALRARLVPEAEVVIIGGGFIGLEVAATAVSRGCRVTLMEPADRLLKRSMPAVVSAFMRVLHTHHGLDLRLGAQVERVQQRNDGRVVVDTSSGPVLADLVVAGIGVVPNTELAESAGLEVADGIVVDEYCRTSDADIFAAGEVTQHFIPRLGRHVRVESWQVAEKQPAIAAANMLGGSERYGEIPWLWSDQYDCNVQSLGFFEPAYTIVHRGNIAAGSFAVLGLDPQGHLKSAVTVNSGRDMAALKRLVEAGSLDVQQLADPSVSLRSLIPR